MRTLSLRAAVGVVLAASGIAAALTWGTGLGGAPYVLRQAYHQLELLAGRVAIDSPTVRGHFDARELEALDRVPGIKEFAVSMGLEVDGHYETINPTFRRTIWNISACDPLAFRPARWGFPIVGTVPYLGFFREADARDAQRALKREGYDVYRRTAGAYSTLGWFDDPLLPGMLSWSEAQLSNTLIHELAHATLWLPGSVQFNESFASFVGDTGAMDYLIHTYGEDSPEVRELRQRREDSSRFRQMLQGVYQELETLYARDDLDARTKRNHKAAIFTSLPRRVAVLGLHRGERYIRWVSASEWNNARILQFRTYNRSHEWFEALYEQEGRDMQRFLRRVEEVANSASDPYVALAEAVGADVQES